MPKKRNRLAAMVERAASDIQSKQPRFTAPASATGMLDSFFGWARLAALEEPPYTPVTTKRDAWLSEFWRKESHLAGVLNTMIDIDKNRGWSMTGGRNQVRLFSDVLYSAEAGRGWRHYTSLQATSFYTTDIGAITEIGRALPMPEGRMTKLWHVDPTLCALRAHQTDEDPEKDVLEYNVSGNEGGSPQLWKSWDFFRTVSMPDIRDRYHGAGWCAVSRCLELVKLLIAVFEHDKEELGAAAPRGFLALNGYTDDQWEDALAKRKEDRDNAGALYFNDVMVLTSNSIPVDVKLVSLSQLPGNFDLEQFVQTMMQGIALCFGIDVAEVYSVRAGAALGIGMQSQVQSAKARTKGENSFWLNHQENIQRELPDTLDFEVDQRSDEGDKVAIEARQLEANLITTLYSAAAGNKKVPAPRPGALGGGTGLGQNAGQPKETRASEDEDEPDDEPLITRDEARRAIIEAGVLPKGILTDDKANSEISDLGIQRSRARDNAKVRVAAERWPAQPIIRRDHLGREFTLFDSGEELLARRFWQVLRPERALLPEPVKEIESAG